MSVVTMVEENRMYQQLEKISTGSVCRIKVFRANLGKFGQNILFTPNKLPASTHMCCSNLGHCVSKRNRSCL